MGDPRRWGVTLKGVGDVAVAADALEGALTASGMRCRRAALGKDRIEISACQTAAWPKIVLRCLPQRTDWLLVQKSRRLEVSGDLSTFRWYRWLTLVLGLAATAGTVGTWLMQLELIDPGERVFHLWVLATVAAFIALAYLWLGGARHREEVWQALLARVEDAGGSLEPAGSSVGRRRAGIYAVLLSLAFSLGALAIRDVVARPSLAGVALLVACAAIVAFLLSTAALMARKAEISYRADAAVTGLATLVTVLFFVSPMFLWMAIGDSTALLERLSAVEQVLESEPVMEDGAAGAVAWKTKARVALAVIVSPLVVAVAFFVVLLISRSPLYAALLRRLQREERRGKSEQATRGGAHLRTLRWLFGVSGSVVALLVFGAFLMLLLAGFQAASPSFPWPEADLIACSAAIARIAVSGWVDAGLATAATRLAWIVHAASGLALLALSLGQLFQARFARLAELSANSGQHHGDGERACRILDRIARCARLGAVELAVLPRPSPVAFAECFLRWGREYRFVVLHQGAFVDFGEAELEALIAHEVVHLREGHCRNQVLMRWLGRTTFLGDGFVLALLDRFGDEQEADRILLDESLASAGGLERSLVKMQHAGGGWSRDNGTGRVLSEQLRGDRERALAMQQQDLPLGRRLALGWSFFRQQYVSATYHSWHPPYRERLQAVRSWRRNMAADGSPPD